ncbi:hypothetical protein [Nocardiopsis sp. ATB16-24]|uniref:hypothetical protein n=1 Tax=Nocardiopsis sp. ATB16-24 TaxID=3019555 RepID=UPI002552F954|nr:hypothetical protein [Nocardiopsis sp. ATB16-24]
MLPPSWASPPAAGAVQGALGVAYGADVAAVAAAWESTFGAVADADQAGQETGSINRTPTEELSETTPPAPGRVLEVSEGVSPWSTDAGRVPDLPGTRPETPAPTPDPRAGVRLELLAPSRRTPPRWTQPACTGCTRTGA